MVELPNGSRAIGKVVFAKRKPRPAGKILELPNGSRAIGKVGFAKRKPRPAGKIFWELSVAAIDCSAKDSGSDFLSWHSPRVWVFVESVTLIGSSASCFGSLYATRVFVGERLIGSFASKSIRLVGSRIGSRLGSFVGLLNGCCNRIKWLTRTWSPATELRLVNAFAWLAKRKSANSTKNFERAGIAFNPFGSIDVQ